MNEEERNAIEYLKTRLYGNEGCKYIDVAQEDLRIFINLVDRKEKDIEGWKKHCEEIEEEQTEMSNKNCELEFEVEKLQKENEELKNKLLDTLEGQKVIKEETPQYIKENYISKEKIKDKIKKISEIKGDFATYIATSERIKALSELLESEE
jgi:predicted nuclease with TOPRIM domain